MGSGWAHGGSLLDRSLGWGTTIRPRNRPRLSRESAPAFPISLVCDERAPSRTRLPVTTTLLLTRRRQQARPVPTAEDAEPRAGDITATESRSRRRYGA